MNRFYSLFFILLFFLINSCSNSSDTYNVMSFNIRLDVDSDGVNSWDNRKQEIVSIIKNQKIDILGIQEGLPSQISYLSDQLDEYNMIGQGRDGGNNGEYSAIFYNNEKLSLNDSETFWLSNTPNIPSIGWDAALNRIATVGSFTMSKSNDKLIIYNSHFDHIGKIARENSVDVILKHIEKNNFLESPIVVMGDFNSEPNETPIKKLSKWLNDSFYEFPIEEAQGTFNGFDVKSKLRKRIDYIFTKNIQISNYTHIMDRLPNGLWPSDHLPIVISFSF